MASIEAQSTQATAAAAALARELAEFKKHSDWLASLRKNNMSVSGLVRQIVFDIDGWNEAEQCEHLRRRDVLPGPARTAREGRVMRRPYAKYLADAKKVFAPMAKNGEFDMAEQRYSERQGIAPIDMIMAHVNWTPRYDNSGQEDQPTPPEPQRSRTPMLSYTSVSNYQKQAWE